MKFVVYYIKIISIIINLKVFVNIDTDKLYYKMSLRCKKAINKPKNINLYSLL